MLVSERNAENRLRVIASGFGYEQIVASAAEAVPLEERIAPHPVEVCECGLYGSSVCEVGVARHKPNVALTRLRGPSDSEKVIAGACRTLKHRNKAPRGRENEA